MLYLRLPSSSSNPTPFSIKLIGFNNAPNPNKPSPPASKFLNFLTPLQISEKIVAKLLDLSFTESTWFLISLKASLCARNFPKVSSFGSISSTALIVALTFFNASSTDLPNPSNIFLSSGDKLFPPPLFKFIPLAVLITASAFALEIVDIPPIAVCIASLSCAFFARSRSCVHLGICICERTPVLLAV